MPDPQDQTLDSLAQPTLKPMPASKPTPMPLRLAVVGAGPVGLALAVHAARQLPQAHITVFDARAPGADLARDPRTLALALGSVQFLQRLQAWRAASAQAIAQVHVSQAAPSLAAPLAALFGEPVLRLSAAALGVPQLGAVLRYGDVLAPLEAAWTALAQQQPGRLHTRLGTTVAAINKVGQGVEINSQASSEGRDGSDGSSSTQLAEPFDLAVVAEGGVFAEQSRKAVVADYGQTAWVGTVQLRPATGSNGANPATAYERFTRHGPVALLPLPAGPAADGACGADMANSGNSGNSANRADAAAPTRSAALVWCVASADDPVRDLSDAQRLALLQTLLPAEAGRLLGLSPLKSFALGLNAERTLVAGRVVRIGNAAQTLHPVAGQGLNLGLRDAFVLVRALQQNASVDAALRSANWARAADRWATIATTDFLARSFTWALPGAASARGLGLAALQAAPPVQRWLARHMMFGVR